PEGLLARGALHQSRPDRVLQSDRTLDAAVPLESATRYDPVSGRHRRQIVLPEGRSRIRAGVDPDRPHLERRYPARDPLLRLRRRGLAPVHREPRLDSTPYLGEPRRLARAPRLVRHRPRSQGGAIPRRDSHRAGAPPSLRIDRAGELREDHRQDWTAHTAP